MELIDFLLQLIYKMIKRIELKNKTGETIIEYLVTRGGLYVRGKSGIVKFYNNIEYRVSKTIFRLVELNIKSIRKGKKYNLIVVDNQDVEYDLIYIPDFTVLERMQQILCILFIIFMLYIQIFN